MTAYALSHGKKRKQKRLYAKRAELLHRMKRGCAAGCAKMTTTGALNEYAIGIFDSGIGGLTVLREIKRHLPMENIIYLGDTARVPYGTRSAQTVLKYSIANTDFLLKQNIKLLIIACNTASAIATEALRTRYAIPVVEVITPGARGAARATTEP